MLTSLVQGIDFHSFLSHTELGSGTLESGGGEGPFLAFARHEFVADSRSSFAGSDAWGWTSSSGREFAIVTQTDGTAFAEIDRDGQMKYLGRLPTQTVPSLWRDAKVSGDYVYIGSEALGHVRFSLPTSERLKTDLNLCRESKSSTSRSSKTPPSVRFFPFRKARERRKLTLHFSQASAPRSSPPRAMSPSTSSATVAATTSSTERLTT